MLKKWGRGGRWRSNLPPRKDPSGKRVAPHLLRNGPFSPKREED